MKHLTIVVPNGQNNLSSITGSYEILTRANEYWKQKGNKDIFKIELAGVSKKVDFNNGLFEVKPHTQISEIQKTNLIIIPSLNHNYTQTVQENKVLINWLEEQYKKGAEIAS
ncbi:MAG TPA: AraC family transcriptional regulator, partial [Bacteroidia bacterium]|nr:AraC family transcriptional regulator [Bacteroidia bacterium]